MICHGTALFFCLKLQKLNNNVYDVCATFYGFNSIMRSVMVRRFSFDVDNNESRRALRFFFMILIGESI